jgi:hypothetical protein
MNYKRKAVNVMENVRKMQWKTSSTYDICCNFTKNSFISNTNVEGMLLSSKFLHAHMHSRKYHNLAKINNQH